MNTTDTAAIMERVRRKGVKLWVERGALRYRAPKGALTQQEIHDLRAASDDLVHLLCVTDEQQPAVPLRELRSRLHRAPLAFAQRAHWQLYQLRDKPAIRHIASATRLLGPLNLDVLRESLHEMSERHDALRTRIVVVGGVPMQEARPQPACTLVVEDLSGLPQELRESEVRRRIEELILEPIDVAVDPLFGSRLLRLHAEEHVLVLAMEHMISDMYSMALLLRELFTAYAQLLSGRRLCLPEIRMQFTDYAAQQHNAQAAWIEEHGPYWESRLGGWQRLRFPADPAVESRDCLGWGTAPIRIEASLKLQLLEWCRHTRTTLALGIFAAYVAYMLRWCGSSEGIVQFVTDGRSEAHIENTIGFLASTLFLRVRLGDDDRFAGFLRLVVNEFCSASAHADAYYMATQVPRPDFTRTAMFNYVPHGSRIEPTELAQAQGGLAVSPVPFANPALTRPMLKGLALDYEPMILLHDTGTEILGGVHFPLNRFSPDAMTKYAGGFLAFTLRLLTDSQRPLRDLPLD